VSLYLGGGTGLWGHNFYIIASPLLSGSTFVGCECRREDREKDYMAV
jgi:hypothetical protein